MPKYALAVACGLVSALVATGCGDKQKPIKPSQATTKPATTAGATPKADSVPPGGIPDSIGASAKAMFHPWHSYRADSRESDGTTNTYLFDVGKPMPADGSKLPTGFKNLQPVCEVDTERDIELPFELTAVNTTPRFSSSPLILLGFKVPQGTTSPLKMAYQLADGPRCSTDNDGGESNTLLIQYDHVAYGQRATTKGVFIVPNYYSPAHPDGDTKLLSETYGSFGQVSCLSGPGRYHGAFALDGSPVSPQAAPNPPLPACHYNK